MTSPNELQAHVNPIQSAGGMRRSSHPPLVSFCSTNFNTSPITQRSIESILDKLGDFSWEMVVVDNFSSDGSFETLQSLQDSFPLVLDRFHCTRGRGRQRALELSKGEIIVTFDLDTVYNEGWARLLQWVVSKRAPYGISAVYSQFYPRGALTKAGGWRDLQYWEDVDLWVRLASIGMYRTYPLVCGENFKRVGGRGRLEKAMRLYAKYRDKVATTPHIPFSLYWQGFLLFLASSRKARFVYYLTIFVPAFVSGKRKNRRLQLDVHRTSVLLDPALRSDLGFVPEEQLQPHVSQYDTLDGCREALAKGDIGFIPGTYD